ncbi:MAG: hypothetical protein HOH82_11870 [Planctomycetaceae bacterium]|jgi:hypothetical protein|nr:hypothetical protein [Planctomycetaceae bacterium]
MRKNLSPAVAVLTMTLLMVAGCADSSDEQFRQLAQQTIRQQAAQNERMAKQSHEIAEASRRLVQGDAEARKDLLAAQRQLTSELHSERASIDRQREEMERERQNIAAQRHRDPIVAQAIATFGLTLACLAPLALAAFIIRAVTQDGDENAALGDLLVVEMTSEKPMLLPIEPRPAAALEHSPAKDDNETVTTTASSAD